MPLIGVSGTVTYNPASNILTDTPNASIDYTDERLIELVADAAYSIRVSSGSTDYTAATDKTLSIPADWLGKEISIVKKASNITFYTDSEAQSLTIPGRPAKPTNLSSAAPTSGSSNGKIGNLTASTAMKWAVGYGLISTTLAMRKRRKQDDEEARQFA